MNHLRKFILSVVFISITLAGSTQSVYKTPSGEKYHLESCRMAKNVSKKISLAEALESGLEPCKICKPPVSNQLPSYSNKAKGESTTTQCKGITKAGTRCKHMTNIADGYCYQHRPG
jgi:hypothetical protein